MPISMPHGYRLILCVLLALIACSCVVRPQDGVKHNTFSHAISLRAAETIDLSISWFDAAEPKHIKGVALVIHGLNLRPDKMESLISVLTASGVAVLNLSLRGHGNNFHDDNRLSSDQMRMKAFKTVSHSIWLEEAYHAYCHAQNRSKKQNVPLFLVGFSYGALLGGDLFASHPNVHINKMALFAPAFTVTIGFGLKWLAPFPRLVIPSFSSTSYRANAGTPMAAYNTLYSTITHFKEHLGPKLNVPTVIFIDPKDELVSHRKLTRMIEAEKLTRWKIHRLQKGTDGVKTSLHHLIIDEASLGGKAWNMVRTQMIKHLLPAN